MIECPRGIRGEVSVGDALTLANDLHCPDCKSVAKATKVRILHLPPSAPRGPDQRQRWSGPLACTPVGYSALRARRCFCKPLTCGNVGARSVCGEYVGKSGSRAGVFHVPRAGDLRRCGGGVWNRSGLVRRRDSLRRLPALIVEVVSGGPPRQRGPARQGCCAGARPGDHQGHRGVPHVFLVFADVLDEGGIAQMRRSAPRRGAGARGRRREEGERRDAFKGRSRRPTATRWTTSQAPTHRAGRPW